GEIAQWRSCLDEIRAERGALSFGRDGAPSLWIATERLPLLLAACPGGRAVTAVAPPAEFSSPLAESDDALRELVRGRLGALGPVTLAELARPLGLGESAVEVALLALQAEGFVMGGRFSAEPPGASDKPPGAADESPGAPMEWCERPLLARIHRYTLNRLRREIEPVEPRDFMRFLFEWQHLAEDSRVEGPESLVAVLAQLEGFEAPAACWEPELLAARIRDYDSAWLDEQCTSGRIAWTRLRAADAGAGPGGGSLRQTPLLLLPRRHANRWTRLAPQAEDAGLSPRARRLIDFLADNGASFFDEIADGARLLRTELEAALA